MTRGDQWDQWRIIFRQLVGLELNSLPIASLLRNGRTGSIVEQTSFKGFVQLDLYSWWTNWGISVPRRPPYLVALGRWLADQVANRSIPRNYLLYGIIVQTMFHARLRLLGACYNRQGHAADCQGRADVPEKANPYNTIVQTTNQAATRV